jgi:hypothetical protein
METSSGPVNRWETGSVLVAGATDTVPGFTFEHLGIAEHSGKWHVVHVPSGLKLGSFDTKPEAAQLGEDLIRANLSKILSDDPEVWREDVRKALEEARTESATRSKALQPVPLRLPLD